jgi:hypothetical protein
VSSVPGIGDRVQPSADVGAGTVTAYFVDNGCLGVLVRLELYPDKDGPDFHFLGDELGRKPETKAHYSLTPPTKWNRDVTNTPGTNSESKPSNV